MNNNFKNINSFQNQSYNPNGETPIVPITPTTIYNLKNAVLKDGAKINNANTMVIGLGGTNNGSATIALNMLEGGQYNIYLNFRTGPKPFRIDINGLSTGRVYITPNERSGVFNTILTLNSGINILKFYGDDNKGASALGEFTLVKIFQKLVTSHNKPYDVAKGNLEKGANINYLTSFVTSLGGITDGSSTVNIDINKAGRYNVEIEYVAYDIDTTLKIDVNGINTGYYMPPLTDGWALDNVLNFNFSIDLKLGTNEIKFHGDGINPSPDLGKFSLTLVNETPIYDYENFNSLSFTDLINLLKSINYTDIKGLYDFTDESKKFFLDSTRVDALINAIVKDGKTFSLINNEGFQTLIEVLKAGYYLGYNNDELQYLNDLKEKEKCLLAIKTVQKNPNFRLIIDKDNKIIKSIASLIEYTTLDVEVINNFTSILEQFKNNIKISRKEYKKRDAIYKILNSIELILNEFLEANGNNLKLLDVYGKIDTFLNSLESLCVEGVNSPKYAYEFFINVISYVGKLSKFRINKSSTEKILSQCVSIYPYFSRINIEALVMLKRYFNGKLFDGTDIKYNETIEKIKNYYLPNWYKFDDGKILIRAGRTLTKEKIKKFYWSIQEVKAEFFRFSGNDTPLEQGNDNILKIIIYGSLEDFKLNHRLYNYNTKNMGGVYLEHLGMIFTCERTTSESSFLLEETFRHEYIHYLEQRFITPGLDNTGDFYENGNSKRLLWFGEGLADFLAGSTRKEGVKPREAMAKSLDKATLKSIKEILKTNEWRADLYYDYFAFIYYLYNNRRDILNNVRDLIMNNDVTLFDALMDTLAHDKNLNDDFHRVIEDLIDNGDTLTTPLASDEYLATHTNGNIQEIKDTILSTISLKDIKVTIETSDDFKTFLLSGTYNAGTSIDALTDWSNMNKTLNNVLSTLDSKPWSGYKTVTAYFTDYTANKYNQITFKVTFHGFLATKFY